MFLRIRGMSSLPRWARNMKETEKTANAADESEAKNLYGISLPGINMFEAFREKDMFPSDLVVTYAAGRKFPFVFSTKWWDVVFFR